MGNSIGLPPTIPRISKAPNFSYNRLEMIDNLLNILQQECRLMTDSSVLVGVSGGPDSLCLMDLLTRTEYPLTVATFDHLLRSQSGSEVEMVREYCTDHRITFVTGAADVRLHAGEHGLSIEESARQLRYDFLFRQAEMVGASAVAVAHTADDQVETILMHLLRGAGPSGLTGMRYRTLPNPWSTTIPIIRPLLSTWRNEIDQYIEQHALPVSLDLSNQDVRFFRNRVRHELIPALETYNPNVRAALWKTARLLADEQAVLDHVVEAAWHECVDQQLSVAICFDADLFNQLPPAVQRLLLRKAISQLLPDLRDVEYEAIERARQFFQSPSRSQTIHLMAGLHLTYEMAKIWLAWQDARLPELGWPQLDPSTRKLLNVPGKVQISPQWELQASFRNIDRITRQQVVNNQDPYQAWLDPERLSLPLLVRTRQVGDRFQPLGFDEGSIKLSDFFINEKLPRRARDDWPIICSGETVCWVPGFRSANPFRITEHTLQAVHLHLRNIDPEDG